MSTTVICPNGHMSTTADYCDQCGTRIGVPGPPAAAPTGGPSGGSVPDPTIEAPVGSEPAASQAAAGQEQCPTCGAGRVGQDRFCESCGYDFVAGTTPAEAAEEAAAAQTAHGSEPAWDAVVSADRAYFERAEAPDVTFPPHCPDRSFPLAGAELRVGRRSTSRGIYPEIDLSGAPEDPAISHLHVLLVRTADGSYSLVDPGSTNGTTVNDDPAAIPTNTPVPLHDGDRIHLGAWTTITVHARSQPPGA